jgi:uncharacterized membrane protein
MQNEHELLEIHQLEGTATTVNVSEHERLLSAIAAPILAYTGIKRGGFTGFLMGVASAELVYRSLTGHSPLYHALGVNTAVAHHDAAVSVPHEQGIHIEKSVYIARPRSELYAFWRNLSNLPRFMPYLEKARELGETYSHWIATGPIGLMRYHWDAEIINDVKNEMIAWRTVEGSQIAHAGSVRFEPTPNNLGTIVNLELEYIAPGGKLAALLASLIGASPEQQVSQAMDSFVTLMETGKLPNQKGGKLSILPFGAAKPEKVLKNAARRREVERRADYVQMTSEDSFPASDPPASW